MADSNQGASPRQAAFDRIASIYGDNAPAKIDPKSAYDDIARKTRVPANVLMALDEAAGGDFDPARAEANATRLAAAVAENKPMDSAIAELVGDPARASSLMDRAYDIADELYPAPAAPQDRGTDGKVSAAEAIGGTARSALGGAISGIGGAIEAGGVAVDEALRFGADPATDRPTIARGLGRGIGEAVKGGADALTGLSTDDFQEKVAGTAPGGNLLDPSSWTLGDDPSITGLINVAAQGLGSMIPIVAAPGPRAAAVFGSLMGGGEGVENGRKFVEDAATTLDDAGQPEIAKLPEYKSMVRAGRSHEDTVAELARQAENNAGFRQGIVAGLGGAATNRIMSKAEGWLGEGGRLTRAVKKGVAGAGEEGLQEAAEGIAAGTGIEKATGADLDLMQDSFGDFVGGALAGGTMGGIAGAAMRGDAPEAAAPGPMDPARGLPAPRPALPGPTGAAPAAGPDAGPTRGLPAILTGQAPAEQAAPAPAAPISGPDAAIPLPTPTPMAPISAAGAGMEPAAAPLPPLPPEGAAVPVQPEVPMPPAPAPVAPAGPIEDISTTLAANLPVPEPELPQRFPDMKPGKTIDLGLPEGQNVTAVAVREEADGVVVRVNGAEQLLSPEQFDSARDLAKANAAAAKEAAKQEKGQTSASVQPSPAQDAAPQPAPASAMRDGADDAGVGGVPVTGENDLALGENPDAGLAGRSDILRADAGQPAVGGMDAATGADQLGAALTADPADKVGAALRIGISGGPQEYMTSKGKLKIGYTLTGVTKAEANKIDPYSIRTPTGAFVNKDRADAFVAQQGEAIKDTAPVAAAAADVAPAKPAKKSPKAAATGDAFADTIGPVANRPMEGLGDLDFDAWDEKTREDGQKSPAKRAGRDETGRWAKAVVKGLREVAGMQPVTNEKGKAQAPVAFGYGMASELDETNITMAGKNGIQAFVKIGNPWSQGQTVSIMVQITGNPPKPNYSRPFIGGNSYISEGATPAEAAAQIARLVERAERSAKIVEESAPADVAQPEAQQAQAETAPVEDAAPEQPEVSQPAPGILGVLSQAKQDRVAELKAKLAAKARSQASSGIDPEYITLGGELVGLYIEAGVTRFGQMLRDFAATTGLSMKEAQAPMRAAYNHVRDDMDLGGEDISQFDSGEAVMAEVRKAIKAETEAAAADTNPAPGQIAAKTIRADVAVTARGREIPVRYALVEMDSLIPSQTDEGRANPAYDKKLQPRDRSGNKSAEQVRTIAQNLNPALLGESPMASTGAPIILPTGEVLSGNGRTLALRQVYAAPDQGYTDAKFYRDWLDKNGFNTSGFTKPVLVRIADGMSMEDAAAFAREANERDTADMSVSEQAMVDAENLTPAILAMYRGGDVDAVANADFVRAFGKDVMAANDAGRMRDNEGRMTQDAVRRINGALLAKAYGDAGIVAAVLESTDSGIKSIGGALTDVAPVWAQMRAAVEQGTIAPDADITADLVEAVKLVERARREARPLSDFLNQTDMFSGDSVSPGAVKVLGILYRDTGATPFRRPYGRDKMADALSFYAGEALKTTPGVDLLGESADAGAILSTAKGRINDQQDGTQDLFGQRADTGGNPASTSAAGNEPAIQEGQAGVRGQSGSRDGSQGGLTDGAGSDDTGVRQGGVAGAEPQAADGSGLAAGDGPGGDIGGAGVSDQDGAADQLAGGLVADSAGSAGDATGERKGVSPGNFVIDASFPLGEGTPGQKIEANIAAIKLAKALTAENRYPTRAEQEVLARYVGWGGLKRVFDPRETGATGQFGRAQAELKDILTPQEYRAAGRSTADAHYTSRTVVSAMWEKMRAFGFEGGRVLEPTIGAGNFVGLQPADLSSRSEWFASELDKVTGQIAKHLYPDATVFDGTSFERAPFRPGSIDVAIGNPPFGSDVVKSKLHPEIPPLSIHNYVIAKTGLLLRPGGIMGMVVTNRFLDTPNPQGREYLARHFNFMGAVRLPNTAFKANAGTEVTTDIVWFQKRAEGEPAGDLSWLETGVKLGNVEVNGYFAANPQMMLGTPGMDGTMYGGKQEFTLHDDGRDLSAALSEALGTITGSLNERTEALEAAVVEEKPTAAMGIGEMQMLADGRVMIRRDDDAEGAPIIEEVTAETPWGTLAAERVAVADAATAARDAIKKGTPEEQTAAIEAFKVAAAEAGVFKADGGRKPKPTKIEAAIYGLADGLMDANPFFGKAQTGALTALRGLVDGQKLGDKKLAAMKQLLALRRDTQALLRAEHENHPAMEKMRKALAADYRAFVKAHGFIGSRANDALVGGVPGMESALEAAYKPADAKRGVKESAKEAAILRKRIITPYAQIRSARTPADGVHVSLRERGRLDLGFIASLTGSNIEAVTEALTQGENPQAFFDPTRDEFVIADEYLSGNLAEKIEAARKDGRFDNVRALEAAMPAPKTAQQITPSIRSMWIPANVFEDFLRELGAKKPKVSINRAVGMVETEAGMGAVATDFGKTFGTERVSAFTVFANAVKGKAIVVYDVEQGGKRVKNETETTNANAAIDRMAAEFQKWAYVNADRQAAIVDAFNTTMNVIVPRKFDGVRYLTQVGANPEIQMRNSQKNGAWRQMLSKSTLLHHVVGAGKTFTAITAIMEGKRLGLYRKSLVTVPNHLVSQWARDFYALYPGANILAATEKDFSAKNRRKLIARIATGDYDAIIIGHSQLAYMANDPAKAAALIEEQVNDLQESMEEAKRSGQNRGTVAQMQKRISKLEDRLKALAEEAEKGENLGFTFLETGIDNLVVDEAQEFKNLQYSTAADRLVGMNSPDGSQKALDLYTKTRSLLDGPGSVAFLTGTPVSNSLVEIYTVMKYLAPGTLREMGLMHYDSWASSFVQSKTRFEYTAAQKLKERNVLAGLVNLGPLSELYKTFADIVMRPDVERMYQEQMEAENAANGTNKSTRFPTPEVRGGGRQLVTIPASDLHKEFTDYLVLRMEGIKRNASDKDYMKKDNALWVLSDARKASIDIRTVDPTAHRSMESKVVRSGTEILRIAKMTEAVKGTQMVFADSSVPLKNAGKDIEKTLKAAWEKAGLSKGDITSRMERDKRQGKPYAQQWGDAVGAMEDRMASGDLTPAQMDALEEWMNGEVANEGAGNAMTADTGFSFYDDLKAYLVENGMDPEQIAFIHDYSTAAQKSALFEAVNAGDVRVLIGSTFKMGAGTNAQQRLVALHHIDAPWRPSDMEQREGRIIRQGNDLYAADIGLMEEAQPGLKEAVSKIYGNKFEVDILAYTTEQTSDVVMWQVLERKANGIEQFLNATADTLIEEDGDADSYAEFMAQSTGNPVFMQKMQAEKDVRDMEAALSSLQMISNDAQRRIEDAPERIARNEARLAAIETLSFDAYPDAGSSFDAYLKAQAAYEAARQAHKEEETAVRERNAKLTDTKKREKLPKFDMTPPVMFDGTPDAYMKHVRDAILEAQENGDSDFGVRLGPDLEIRITANDYVGMVDLDAPGPKPRRYYAELTSRKLATDGVLRLDLVEGGAVAKNPLASRALVFNLTPDAIRDRLARGARNVRADIEKVNADLPKAREAAAKAPDRRPLEKKKRELRMLEGRARVAEVAAARARVGRSNRFADMDIKDRDLVSDKSDDAPLTPASGGLFRFTQGDTTLVAGFGAKAPGRWLDDADGQRHDQYWFEAVADDGDLVMVLAARINTKDADAPTIKVIDTFPTGITGVTPATKESRFTSPGEGRARKSDKITPADARRINAAARAELEKVGIADRIRVQVGGNGTAAGTYQRGVIGILRGADGNWRHTLDHEIIHALRDSETWGGEAGLFSRDEWRALVRAARADDAVRARVEKAYKDKTTTEQTEEMVAEFYADWSQGRREAEPGMMTEALNRIRSFFRAAAAALRGEGFQDAATIMQKIADGSIGGRGPDGPGTGQAAPLREQRNMDSIRAAMASGRARAAGMVSREYWSKRPEVWSNLLTDAMGKDARFNILGLVPGQPLFNELGKNLMGAQSYLANKQAMDTDRNEWQAKAATTVDGWTKTGRKNPEANDRLMELMHDSTIAGIDPSKDDEWSHTNAESLKRIEAKATPTDKEAAFAARISKEIEDHQDTYDRLRRQYNALPAEFKDLYSTIRDEYSAMADATDSALLASVQIATDIAAKKARLDHAKELRRIEDDGLKGSERDAAIEKADATLAAARERAGKSGKARMIQMRAGFEANRMKGPYFPLTRFGNYFVTIRDANGAVISFSRFEKKGEQAAEIERATAEGQAEGWKISHGVLTDSADIRGAVDPVFIQEIETILAGTGASSDTMDAVWQHWLESLPDMSIRKNKIHRKGRSGFQKDAVRAFSSAMFHGAHNLARLKYGLKMDDNLNDAEAEAARQTDAERAGFVVREMRQRHAFTMKPTNNPIVTAGTSLAFVWYLGMSPASAMVNITQTTVFGIPIFATRFRDAGVTGSSAALMKAMQDFGQGRGWTEKSKNLTADEKDALRRAYERGTIDKTQAHDLAAVAESGVQYNPTREKAMRVIGFLFHHAERFNREVTFLAAYRLLRAEGKDMDASLEEADSLVKKIHFDYQNTSRPRVMQGDFAKILLTFRNFTVNALYRLFRDSHQAMAGATAEERREARGQLVGITLSMMAHAGIKGTWGFGLLMALLGIFTGDDQEPEDWLQDVLLMEGDDPATAAWNWTMGMALNGVPGHVTGTNLTERLGMPNLWFRSPREGTEGQDVWTHYLNEVVGPVFGLGGQWMSGLSMIGDAWGEGNGDNLMRGAEKLVPNFISNGIIKPSRFGVYGANTYYGDPLMDVGPLDVIKTAMGFTPAELAERYAINAKLKAREKAIMGRRSDLHKKIGNALNEGRGIPADVLEDLRAFNAEYPEHPVTPDTIKASMGSRARAKARNEFGAALNPKLNDRIRGDMPPSVYNG